MPQGAAKVRSRRDLFRVLLGESPGGEGESKEDGKPGAPEGGAEDGAAAPAPRRKGARPGAIPAVRLKDTE